MRSHGQIQSGSTTNALDLCPSCGCWGKQMTMSSAAEFEQAGPQNTLSSESIWVSKGGSGLHAWKDQQKCTSVPDFRRNSCSLQLRGVKWTSPSYFNTRFTVHFTPVVK